MECNIIKDLIPLYIDGCCSEESARLVREHTETCAACKHLIAEMKEPSDIAPISKAPTVMNKLSYWKASVMQSVLLFLSFALITAGVALESRTPIGSTNGYWAVTLIIPATGFMLSLASWYFIQLYKSRRAFSVTSALATLGITVCAYVWAIFHYKTDLLAGAFSGVMPLLRFAGIGILLTVLLCALSGVLSERYARMLGKE